MKFVLTESGRKLMERCSEDFFNTRAFWPRDHREWWSILTRVDEEGELPPLSDPLMRGEALFLRSRGYIDQIGG